MQSQDLLRRIESNPAIFGGKPVIRGRRIAVEHILSMLAAGDSPDDILEHFPFLDAQDIEACLGASEVARSLTEAARASGEDT